MTGIIEFFKNVPKKKCTKCGKAMQNEKADCYGNICDDCDYPGR